MADLQKDAEKKFNETLQRMLKTPPNPHEKALAEKKPAHLIDHRQSDEQGPIKRRIRQGGRE
jgi:hypothetical protein